MASNLLDLQPTTVDLQPTSDGLAVSQCQTSKSAANHIVALFNPFPLLTAGDLAPVETHALI